MLISKLCDRYEILHNLGPMGAVSTYIARDTHRPSRPQCVVKKIVSSSSDPASLKQVGVYFKREAELLGILGTHDQIPQLIDYFEDHGAFYLVQGFVTGESLDKGEIAPGHLPWSEIDVINFLKEVLGILQFVHEHQVIHGDIKPNSIIRRSQDRKLVLTDFDAIKLVQVPNQPISVPGTPGYMAPEQASGMHFASDIYALGITAMQALTGVEPQYLPKDVNGNITCLRNIRVSDGLATVLNKMVRSDYKERYQSAAQTLEALNQIPDIAQAPKESTVLVPTVPKRWTDKIRAPLAKRLWMLVLIPVIAGISVGGFVVARHQFALAEQRDVLEKMENHSAQQAFDDCIALSNQFPGPPSSDYAIAASTLGAECNRQLALAQQHQTLIQMENYLKEGLFDDCITLSNQLAVPQSSEQALTALNLEARCLLGKAQQFADPPTQYVKAIETAQGIVGMQVAGQSVDAAILEEARQKIDNWSEEIVKVSNKYFSEFKQEINSGKLYEAIRILNAVPEDTSAYPKIVEQLERWGDEMLQMGKQIYSNAKNTPGAEEGLRMLSLIPEEVSAYEEAEELIPVYKQHENEMNRAEESARNALGNGRCRTARGYVETLKNSPYSEAWRTLGGRLEQQVRECETPLSGLAGSLSGNSPVIRHRGAGRSYAKHTFQGYRDQRVKITMESDDFDTYLILFDPDMRRVTFDDDSLDNHNSLITRRLRKTGEYTIYAASYNRVSTDQSGSYRLNVTAREPD